MKKFEQIYKREIEKHEKLLIRNNEKIEEYNGIYDTKNKL